MIRFKWDGQTFTADGYCTFRGRRGSGKSTRRAAMAARLQAAGHTTLFVDEGMSAAELRDTLNLAKRRGGKVTVLAEFCS